MEKLKPFVENILYDTIVPILFITEKDIETFSTDPIEYIRNQYDFTETLFQPKNQVQDLLCYLCKYSSQGKKKKAKPDYLHKFLKFTVDNLDQYNQKVNSQEGADWRIKEALMFAIGCLKDEIESQKDLKKSMEQMLLSYVLPELTSEQPFMRLRACQTYGTYGDIKFKDETHVPRIVEGIYKNMTEDQPLPVRFQAACALERIIRIDVAAQFIRPGLDTMLKCYLSLMNEFDNEELVSAFENIMTIFQQEIRPYAVDICNHLVSNYKRCIAQDQAGGDEWGESILAACAAVTSIRRILDALSEDVPLMHKVEEVIYPVLLHSLTVDGLDAIEEGIDCLTIILCNGYKKSQVSANLWKLYPQLLYVCAGTEGETEGGFGLEYVNQVVVTLKNYISRDPEGMLRVGEGQDET